MSVSPPSRQSLAKALRINLRTLQRHLAAGMPKPKDGETVAAWAKRARAWRRKSGGKGRKRLATAGEKWLADYRRARAERAAIALDSQLAQLHSRARCDQLEAVRLEDVRGAISGMAEQLAAAITTEDDEYVIVDKVSAAIAARMSSLTSGGMDRRLPHPANDPMLALAVDDRDPLPPADAPLLTVSEYWLARWRRTRTKREQLALALDRGALHRVEPCESDCVRRAQTFANWIYAMPTRVARVLKLASPELVRDVIGRDIGQALVLFHLGDDPDHAAGVAEVAEAAATEPAGEEPDGDTQPEPL